MRPEKSFLKFRRRDLIAIAFVLLAAAGIFVLFFIGGGDTARVYLNGVLKYELPLDTDAAVTVTGDYTNIIEVKDGAVAVTHADCPGGDCVNTGYIKKGVIICAPNGLEVRIGDGEVDAVAY